MIPDSIAFERNMLPLLRGIELCVEQKLTQPALMLIYTAIDIVASLERAENEPVRESFTSWTARYLLKAKTLPCTALELYAARCGLLHTLTPDSKLSQGGKARPVIYAWGTAKADGLQRASDMIDSKDYVALHVNDLCEAFRLGLHAYYEEVGEDPSRQAIVATRLTRWFEPLATDDLDAFLTMAGPSAES